MTKDEMKNKISMALKDPILQQGFECICKENAELKKELKAEKEYNATLRKEFDEYTNSHTLCVKYKQLEKKNEELNKKLFEAEEEYDKMFWNKNKIISIATETIEGLMRFCRCFAQHHTEDIRYKKAEQFLQENA